MAWWFHHQSYFRLEIAYHQQLRVADLDHWSIAAWLTFAKDSAPPEAFFSPPPFSQLQFMLWFFFSWRMTKCRNKKVKTLHQSFFWIKAYLQQIIAYAFRNWNGIAILENSSNCWVQHHNGVLFLLDMLISLVNFAFNPINKWITNESKDYCWNVISVQLFKF